MQQWKNHIQINSWLVIYKWLGDSDISVWNKSKRSSVSLQPILAWNAYRHNLEVLMQVIIPDEHHGCYTEMVLLSSLLWVCVSHHFRTLDFFIGYKINGLTKPLFLSLLKIFTKWWPISPVYSSCVMSSSLECDTILHIYFALLPTLKAKKNTISSGLSYRDAGTVAVVQENALPPARTKVMEAYCSLQKIHGPQS